MASKQLKQFEIEQRVEAGIARSIFDQLHLLGQIATESGPARGNHDNLGSFTESIDQVDKCIPASKPDRGDKVADLHSNSR